MRARIKRSVRIIKINRGQRWRDVMPRKSEKGDDHRPCECLVKNIEWPSPTTVSMPMRCTANSMYDFRLSSVLLATVVVAVGAMIGGELSAVEKSLQFEAAFQGKLFKSYNMVLMGKSTESSWTTRIALFIILI